MTRKQARQKPTQSPLRMKIDCKSLEIPNEVLLHLEEKDPYKLRGKENDG